MMSLAIRGSITRSLAVELYVYLPFFVYYVFIIIVHYYYYFFILFLKILI